MGMLCIHERQIKTPFGWLVALAICFVNPAFADSVRPRIAIIIDDLGYERAAGERAIELPGPLAYAVLPGTPQAKHLADAAHAAGKEVLLHLPLQAQEHIEPAEPGSLLLDMSRIQFAAAFAADLQSVPHIIGINTHRGSLLTRHPGHMRWLMDEIVLRGNLFFIDSYTTAQSVALSIARENSVPSVKRDVFLDPDQLPNTVEREFARLKKIARRQGFAVGIGHPYPATLDYLELTLPELVSEGYDLIRISDLIAIEDPPRRGTMRFSGE
jgi:polysaccharide deacetylase 2 family uncharacterized protein YibQ